MTAQKRGSPKPRNGITLQGSDVFDAYRHLCDPHAWKSDEFLLRAARCAKKAKAEHLKTGELRAIAWFAFLPDVHKQLSDREGQELRRAISNLKNQVANAFFEVWLREPDTVLRLLASIRKNRRHPETEQAVADFLEVSESKLPSRGHSKTMDAKRARVKQARRLTRPAREIQVFADVIKRNTKAR